MHWFDLLWSPSTGYAVPREHIWRVGMTTYVLEILSIFLIAAIFYLLARTDGARRPNRH
jgi:hypothetical protein